jgi:hypothetical protein
MADNNLPTNPGPVDAPADDPIERIADLLDEDQETDLPEEGEAEPEPDDGDEPEIDVSEETDEGDEPDGSQDDIKGGRFAPDSAKVTLSDGSVITVAELKRNNLFQADYTRKTTEHAREIETFRAEKAATDQRAQELAQYAEYIDWYSQNYLPKAPEFQGTPDADPIGYMKYMQQMEEFNKAQGLLNYFRTERNRLTEQTTAEQRQQAQQAFANELTALSSEDPKFWGDTDKMKTFVGELIEKGGEWWGLTKEDLGTLRTSKQWKIVRDALRYRKAVAKAPEAKKQAQARPVLANGGRRADPNAKVSAQKQARSERLRRDGSFQNGVAALMDLDL